MPELVRASLSIEQDLMERFDRFVEQSGHSNRSEAVRDLIRARLLEEEWDKSSDEALATVTLLYDHTKRRLSRQLEEHGHAHHHVVLSSMHIHVSAHLCLEVVVLRGEPGELKHVANHLIGLPGVLHGRAVYSRADLPGVLT
jgi:CopG family nickel-responsive transcriptional regulator